MSEPAPLQSLPRVAAHRGASRLAPENTLAAFVAALNLGAQALELDVHLSRDGLPVVVHDDTLERTTDGSGPVAARSLEELSRLDAGSWFSPCFAGEHLPLLGEVVELSAGRAALHVELKGEHGKALARTVVETLVRLGAARRAVVMSFDLAAALEARRVAPELPVVAIVAARLDDQLAFVRSTGLSGLNQRCGFFDRATIAAFHDDDLLVHGSLVNDRTELEAFFARGGDLADSDAPECFAASSRVRPA